VWITRGPKDDEKGKVSGEGWAHRRIETLTDKKSIHKEWGGKSRKKGTHGRSIRNGN